MRSLHTGTDPFNTPGVSDSCCFKFLHCYDVQREIHSRTIEIALYVCPTCDKEWILVRGTWIRFTRMQSVAREYQS